MSDPRYTPLRERHEALGASFTDFGGWQMPVRYTSDLAEHHAVRESAGIFDISHMAEFLVTGEAAAEFLDYALAGRISAMPVGKAKYSLLLAEGGGIIDDVIAYRLAEDRYLVIANAGNRGFVDSAFAKRVRDFPSLVERDLPARAPGEERSFAGFLGDRGVDVEDVSDDYALIAVQGPNAEAILAATADITDVSIPCPSRSTTPGRRRTTAASRSSSRAPATRARTASSFSSPLTTRRRCGMPCSLPARRTASFPPGSPRATPFASRRGCRSTGTN